MWAGPPIGKQSNLVRNPVYVKIHWKEMTPDPDYPGILGYYSHLGEVHAQFKL